MILDQLLGAIPRAEFMERHYLKQPFALPGGCRHLADTLGWPLVEAMLARPDVDALAARGAEIWPDGVPPAEKARGLLGEGYTLRIRNAEKHDAGLGELAESFRSAFAARVDVHVYCTPAGHPGLGWHYDAEDVFVLQTAGSKEWSLRKNTVHPWPLPETIPANMRYGRELMPMLRCNLHAGDWLYIPAGYWHSTRAGEESISLNVGILSTSAIDVYDFLRRRLLDDLRWRQRLPTPGEASTLDDAELLRQYRELFADLGRDLAELLGREETARGFLEGKGRRYFREAGQDI